MVVVAAMTPASTSSKAYVLTKAMIFVLLRTAHLLNNASGPILRVDLVAEKTPIAAVPLTSLEF